MYIAIAWAFKDDDSHKDNATWQKRLSKAEFLKLPKHAKQRYIETYPHSSYRFLMGGGKGDGGESSFNEQLARISDTRRTSVTKVQPRKGLTEEELQKKADDRARIRRDIADHNKANAHVINRASLQALDAVQDKDLKLGSANIRKNVPDIIRNVKQQADKQPHMFKRGLDNVKALLSGNKKPEDQSITDRHAVERVITGVATMAILGAGILAMGVAAAPLGVLAGRVIFDMWSRNGGEQLREDLTHLKNERQKKRRKRMGLGEETEDDMYERIKAKRDKKQEKATNKHLATASAFDDHDETINLIVEQVADVLRYHSARDFQLSRDEMFSTASSDNQHQRMQRILSLAHCHNFENVAKGFTFEQHHAKYVDNLFQNLGLASSVEGDIKYFYNDDFLITIGPGPEGKQYVRYDGELRY